MPRSLKDFLNLRPAEARLVQWLQAGNSEPCEISPDVPPEDAAADVRLRASFVRYLALGGCDACRPGEKGLRVRGAYIEGDGPEGAETRGLDLEGCRLPGDLVLLACRFPDRVLLRGVQGRTFNLSRSHLHAGVNAERLEATGDFLLRRLKSFGEVRLLGASLGGNLISIRATFTAGSTGAAIFADRLEAKGTVFLQDVTATGKVQLIGAKLSGSLECIDATFNARVGDDIAFTAERIEVGGTVFLRGTKADGLVNFLSAQIERSFQIDAETRLSGTLDLRAARIGEIVDHPDGWPKAIRLDRCRYGAFVGGAPTDAETRIRWLSLQDGAYPPGTFHPHPWEECARALREAGHSGAARTVLIEKERRQRKARRVQLRNDLLFEDAYIAAVGDRILGWTIRYGRQPLLSFVWLAGFWLLGAVIFEQAGRHGAIKPSDPKIQIDPIWADCHASAGHRTQYDCFMEKAEVTAYPQFNALVYSADTLLPVISFEMQSYWLPDDRTSRGWWARFYLWLHIFFGWALTLLAVAGFSGLVKQDSK